MCNYSIIEVVWKEFHLLRGEVFLLVGDCGKEIHQFIPIPDFLLDKLLQGLVDILKGGDFLFNFVDILCEFRSSFLEVT